MPKDDDKPKMKRIGAQIPEDLDYKINVLASISNLEKPAVIRQLLDLGIEVWEERHGPLKDLPMNGEEWLAKELRKSCEPEENDAQDETEL